MSVITHSKCQLKLTAGIEKPISSSLPSPSLFSFETGTPCYGDQALWYSAVQGDLECKISPLQPSKYWNHSRVTLSLG